MITTLSLELQAIEAFGFQFAALDVTASSVLGTPAHRIHRWPRTPSAVECREAF
jgi:hypothetical protein